MIKTYRDITVFISPGSEGAGTYAVRVKSAQAGEGNCTLRLPFQLSDLSGTVFGVEQATRAIGTDKPMGNESASTTEADTRSPKDFGIELFEALFQDTARDVLVTTDSAAKKDDKIGLRIRLSMDLKQAGMAAVASLPWELMCRPNQQPLVLSTQTPLVRSLDTPHPTKLRPFRAPLRILALMSNPQGTEQLNLSKERSQLEQDWARLPGVEVDFVQPVRAEVLKRLRDNDYHVVHYMGHGDFEKAKGGQLLFELADGSPDPISAEDFVIMLHDDPLRLVFLNACKTGTTSMNSDIHPFAGVATALINDGVPAVVAMQFPISDQAAIEFSKTFYDCIASQHPVDLAVAEGRKMLRNSDQAEWATPVLYMRTTDGMLFKPAHGVEAVTGATTDSPVSNEATVATTESEDPWGVDNNDTLRVFLATPDQNLERRHRQISTELKKLDWVRVIDSVPRDELQKHSDTVDKLIRRADICIHMLGSNPGQRLDDGDSPDSLNTFPLKELETGYDIARSQLVIMTREDKESIANDDYLKIINELETRPRRSTKFELSFIDKLEVQKTILTKLEKLRSMLAEEPSEEDSKNAFVDSHVSDQIPAIELVDYLERRHVEARMDVDPPDSITDPEDNTTDTSYKKLDGIVEKTPLYIIVTGNVNRDWVSSRRKAVQKAAVKSRKPLLIAKYTATKMEEEQAGEVSINPSQFEIITSMYDPDTSWVEALFASEAEEGA